jgi:hypothetical protein
MLPREALLARSTSTMTPGSACSWLLYGGRLSLHICLSKTSTGDTTDETDGTDELWEEREMSICFVILRFWLCFLCFGCSFYIRLVVEGMLGCGFGEGSPSTNKSSLSVTL